MGHTRDGRSAPTWKLASAVLRTARIENLHLDFGTFQSTAINDTITPLINVDFECRITDRSELAAPELAIIGTDDVTL
jgi:hypothetical protein